MAVGGDDEDDSNDDDDDEPAVVHRKRGRPDSKYNLKKKQKDAKKKGRVLVEVRQTSAILVYVIIFSNRFFKL